MSASIKDVLNTSIDLTRLPHWVDKRRERLISPAFCLVAFMPLAVILLTPLLEYNDRLLTLHMVTYAVGILGFAYGCVLLYRFYREKGTKTWREWLRGRWMLVFLLSMLLWSVLATALSDHPWLSLTGDPLWKEGLLTQFAYAGLLTLAILLPASRRRLVLDCLVAAAAVQALLCLLNIPWLMEATGMARDSAIYLNSNHYGYYLTMMVPLAAGLLITADLNGTPRRQLLILSLRGAEVVLLSNSAILCRSLGPFGSIVLSLAMLVLLTGLVQRKRLLRCLLVVGLCGATMVLSCSGVWDLGQDLSLRAEDMAEVAQVISSPNADVSRLDDFGSRRGVLWREAVEYIARHPLFGCGPDNLKAAYEEITGVYEIVRPHSEPLQYAMSIGVPGLIFYLCAMFCLLWGFLKNFRRLDLVTVVLFCAIGSYLVSSLVGNTKYYSTPYFFMLVGMAWAATRQAAVVELKTQSSFPQTETNL